MTEYQEVLNRINDAKTDIGAAIAEKGVTVPAGTKIDAMAALIEAIQTGVALPTLTNEGAAADLLSGKQLIDDEGNIVTGSMPSVTQATPSISVSTSGLITASATQSAGKVAAGTKSATKQLTVQAAQTITPGTSNKTIASGRYLTGTQTIKGDANLLAENIKSGVSIFDVLGTLEAGSGGGDGGDDGELDALIGRSITEVNSNAEFVGSYAFYSYGNLKQVNFPACVSVGSSAFYYCTAMEKATFPKCSRVMGSAFANCHNLVNMSFPECKTLSNGAFNNCRSLQSVILPKCSSVGSGAFAFCSELTVAALPACNRIYNTAFSQCKKLTALVLPGTDMCGLNNKNALDTTAIASGTGYVYVPSSLVASYQAATNWTYYSAQISAIEDSPYA